MKPKISVIIPAYNSERFIGEAIESVLAQDYPAHEIIVVNDGSIDGTADVLNQYRRSIIARHTKNQGTGAARNIGLHMATGNYIAFLDVDDLWTRHKLKRHLEAFRKYPDRGLSFSDHAETDLFLTVRAKSHFARLQYQASLHLGGPLKPQHFKGLIRENFIGTASIVVIKKELVDRVGFFNESRIIAEDYEYYLRCAMVSEFIPIHEVLVHKRMHASNFTNDVTRMFMAHRNALEYVRQNMRDYIDRAGLSRLVEDEQAKNHYSIGNLNFESGKIREAFSFYASGLRYSKSRRNLGLYFMTVIRKILRILTLNQLSRRKLNNMAFFIRGLKSNDESKRHYSNA